ncbi:MAG: SIS domain-containing protein [Candidatus Eisenbacteria bacterium]|uniref:Phosphoheptose isomerase n=1 Tax=Eiseniibacteriota bacterium TaxID=2212470 RepID=A0A538TFG3_UNCEI|nr:MAG: SIS domain-containing protein [Candidatus Eisenbacteria bacterium]
MSPRPAKRGDATLASNRVRRTFAESAATLIAVFARELDAIERMARIMSATVAGGRTVFFCGNGGSAAEAQHLATELVGRFVRDRDALPAVALSADGSLITAVGNDYGFERVFARQIEALGRRGDLLVAMTTSGRSPNMLEAVRAARARGLAVIGMTGGGGAAFARRCDAAVVVPSRETARIQEVHLLVGHILCERAEDAARARSTKEAGPRRARRARKRRG